MPTWLIIILIGVGISVVALIVRFLIRLYIQSEKDFICTNCGRTFTPKKIMSPMLNEHDSRFLKCPYCKHKDLMSQKQSY